MIWMSPLGVVAEIPRERLTVVVANLAPPHVRGGYLGAAHLLLQQYTDKTTKH